MGAQRTLRRVSGMCGSQSVRRATHGDGTQQNLHLELHDQSARQVVRGVAAAGALRCVHRSQVVGHRRLRRHACTCGRAACALFVDVALRVTLTRHGQLRVYNYNTLDKVHAWEAHHDYIRSVVVHPTQPFVLSSSDDFQIKLWDWDKNWQCMRTFEGHSHYVMQLCINPKDPNVFASASLDRTIKVILALARVSVTLTHNNLRCGRSAAPTPTSRSRVTRRASTASAITAVATSRTSFRAATISWLKCGIIRTRSAFRRWR